MEREARAHLEKPARRHQAEFLAAVDRSRRLHRPWAAPPRTPAQYRAFLTRIRRPTELAYFVCTESGDLAGFIHLGHIVRGLFHSAYIGYYSFVPYAGRGFMRAGLERVVQLAFKVHRLHRVEANIQPGNLRSRKLVRSLGFRREGLSLRYLKIGGRWRDHERWALTVEDWARPRQKRKP